MEPRKFAVHNQTRESTLSSSVTSVNAALEPLKVLKVLIEGLPANSRTGLWLTNFKGVPVARTLSPFDLVYLDKENRVVQGIELTKDGEFAPPRGHAASALAGCDRGGDRRQRERFCAVAWVAQRLVCAADAGGYAAGNRAHRGRH